MKDATLNKRVRENYEHILNKMTAEERVWAENFERMEYEIERGKAKEAVRIAKALNPNVTQEALQGIKNDCAMKDRCNPALADREHRRNAANRTGERAPKSNMYDASDWVKQKFGYDNQTGETFELAISTNPEDALIQALDAARAHGVSLDEFVNNPKYHTAERKAGRPKKIKE